MKKTRKILSIVLAVLFAFSSMPVVYTGTAAADAVTYAAGETGTIDNPTRPVEASGVLEYEDIIKLNINSQSTSYTFYQTIDNEYFTFGQTQGIQHYNGDYSAGSRNLTFESIDFYTQESSLTNPVLDTTHNIYVNDPSNNIGEEVVIKNNPTSEFLSKYFVSNQWTATNANAEGVSLPFVLDGSGWDITGCKVYTWKNDIIFRGNSASDSGEIKTGYYETLKWNWKNDDGSEGANFDLRIGTTIRVLDARELAKELAEAEAILDNPEKYTQAYLSSVEATLNTIPDDLRDFSTVYDQSVIDSYTKMLKDVSLNSADYTEFNRVYKSLKSITNAKGAYTEESYNTFKARIQQINANLPKNLDKTQQATVDAATQALKDAYELLVIKGTQTPGSNYTETKEDVAFTVGNDFKFIQIKDNQFFSFTQPWTIDRRNLDSKDSRRMFYSVLDTTDASTNTFASKIDASSVKTVDSLTANAIDGTLTNQKILSCWKEVDANGNAQSSSVINADGTINGSYDGFEKDKVYYLQNMPVFSGLSATESGEHTYSYVQKIFLNWQQWIVIGTRNNYSNTSFRTTITITDARHLVKAVADANATLANPGTHSKNYITALQAAVDAVPVELIRGVEYHTQAEVDKLYNDITTIPENAADYSKFVETFEWMLAENKEKYTEESYNIFIAEIYSINQNLPKNLAVDKQGTIDEAVNALYVAHDKLVSVHLNNDNVFTQEDITDLGNNPLEFSVSSTQYNFMQVADGQKFAIRTELTARNAKARYNCSLLSLRFSSVVADTVDSICAAREKPDKGCHNGEMVISNQTDIVINAVSGVNVYSAANDAGDIGEHTTWVNTEGKALSTNGILNDPTALTTSDSSAYAEMYYTGPTGNHEDYTGIVDANFALRLGWSYYEEVLGIDGETIRRHAHIPVNIKITDARALNSLYEETDNILNGKTDKNYTFDSLVNLYEAFNKVDPDMAYGSEYYTQDEVNAAYAELKAAYGELVAGADYSEYFKAYVQAEEIINSNNTDSKGNALYEDDAYSSFVEKVTTIDNGLSKNLPDTEENQATVNTATQGILNALSELENQKFADYSRLNDAMTEAEKILAEEEANPGTYTKETIDAIQEAYNNALQNAFNNDPDAIHKELHADQQTTVDAAASALEAVIADKEYKADYSEFEEAYNKVQDIVNAPDGTYTEETVQAAKDALVEADKLNKDLPDLAENREIIENATNELKKVFDDAKEKADYSEFEEALEDAKEIVNAPEGTYTDETVKNAQDAIDKAEELDKDLPKDQQADVDAVRDAVKDAVENAKEKADYTEFDKAVEDLENIVNNPDKYTDETVENAQDALDSIVDVDKDLPKSEQDALDEITEGLKEVIESAQEKADYTEYNNAKTEADNLVNDDGNGNPIYDEEAFQQYKDKVTEIDNNLDKNLPKSEENQQIIDQKTQELIDLRTELDASKGSEQEIVDPETKVDEIVDDVINDITQNQGYNEDEIIVEFKNYLGEELLSADFVGTGSTMRVILKSTGELLEYKLFIIMGDVTGDGKVNDDDYKKSLDITLDGEPYAEDNKYFFTANDIDADGYIDVIDTALIRRMYK